MTPPGDGALGGGHSASVRQHAHLDDSEPEIGEPHEEASEIHVVLDRPPQGRSTTGRASADVEVWKRRPSGLGKPDWDEELVTHAVHASLHDLRAPSRADIPSWRKARRGTSPGADGVAKSTTKNGEAPGRAAGRRRNVAQTRSSRLTDPCPSEPCLTRGG